MGRRGISFLWSSLFQQLQLKIACMWISQENTSLNLLILKCIYAPQCFVYAKEEFINMQWNRYQQKGSLLRWIAVRLLMLIICVCVVWEVCNCFVLLIFNPLHHFSHRLCGSYPQEIIVPAWITDKELESVASFRSWKRIPAVVYRWGSCRWNSFSPACKWGVLANKSWHKL